MATNATVTCDFCGAQIVKMPFKQDVSYRDTLKAGCRIEVRRAVKSPRESPGVLWDKPTKETQYIDLEYRLCDACSRQLALLLEAWKALGGQLTTERKKARCDNGA